MEADERTEIATKAMLEQIEARRTALGVSKSELARLAEVDRTTLYQGYTPTFKVLQRLATALGGSLCMYVEWEQS